MSLFYSLPTAHFLFLPRNANLKHLIPCNTFCINVQMLFVHGTTKAKIFAHNSQCSQYARCCVPNDWIHTTIRSYNIMKWNLSRLCRFSAHICSIALPVFSYSGPFTHFEKSTACLLILLRNRFQSFRLMPPFNFIDGENEFDLKGFYFFRSHFFFISVSQNLERLPFFFSSL